MPKKTNKTFSIQEVLAAIDGNNSEFDDDECCIDDDDFDEIAGHQAAMENNYDCDSDQSDSTVILDCDKTQCNDVSSHTSDKNVEDKTKSKTNKQSTVKKNQFKDTLKWEKMKFTPPDNIDFCGDIPMIRTELLTPYVYFKMFISDAMIDMLTYETNVYSVERDGQSIDTSAKEIEQLVGVYFRMGLVKMPSIRAYYETGTRYSPVADIISRNRLEKLLTKLHIVNNNSKSDDNTDKGWKIRPWLTLFRENCLSECPEEQQSVDEMMIPFRGHSSLRQYIKGKPHPWGFKLWARCSPSGFLHDFDLYQGSGGEKHELGVAVGAVLNLTKTLPVGKNYKVFADNLFTSIPLIIKLKEDGIYYAGTVRKNRLPGCILIGEKELKKSGRGSIDYKVETTNNICVVRWYDNRDVTMMSSFLGIEPKDSAKRYDKAKKEYLFIDRPNVIRAYNSSMGGVDLSDMLASLYKYRIRSRRWYIYILFHTMTLALSNAWLLYRRDYRSVVGDKKHLILRKFQAEVATSLIMVNCSGEKSRKRGRPPLKEPSLSFVPSTFISNRAVSPVLPSYAHHTSPVPFATSRVSPVSTVVSRVSPVSTALSRVSPMSTVVSHVSPVSTVVRRLSSVQIVVSRASPVPSDTSDSDSRVSPVPPKLIRQHPPMDVKKDCVSHWPDHDRKRGRCANCSDGYTSIKCAKCSVRLCFTTKRNCFRQYHNTIYINNLQ